MFKIYGNIEYKSIVYTKTVILKYNCTNYLW